MQDRQNSGQTLDLTVFCANESDSPHSYTQIVILTAEVPFLVLTLPTDERWRGFTGDEHDGEGAGVG
ncbi:hypothetical protein IAQ61_009758 [Plenodomus lingam]|uniref:uncharacterized protein n=1 Tax=Leptosphaeria maculans TaxID=5022 RepID=UPI003320A740|nr:hypothetical protein IAQ61_009758 [Plenodomus lingam]